MGGRKIQIKGGKAKTPQVDLDKKSRIKRELFCRLSFIGINIHDTIEEEIGVSEWKADQVMNDEMNQDYIVSWTFSQHVLKRFSIVPVYYYKEVFV